MLILIMICLLMSCPDDIVFWHNSFVILCMQFIWRRDFVYGIKAGHFYELYLFWTLTVQSISRCPISSYWVMGLGIFTASSMSTHERTMFIVKNLKILFWCASKRWFACFRFYIFTSDFYFSRCWRWGCHRWAGNVVCASGESAKTMSRTNLAIRTLLYLQTFFTLSQCAAKLNVPKVLLPFHTDSYTHFTLAASDGCYTW